MLGVRERKRVGLCRQVSRQTHNLKTSVRASARVLNRLMGLRAISFRLESEKTEHLRIYVKVRLDWATEITETEFYQQINQLPEAKTRLVIAN